MFQQAKDNLGQKEPGTDYNLKLAINATVKVAKPIEYSKTSGKPGQSLLLTADNGEEDWVKLTGKFDALDQSSIGKTYEFLVWPFQPDGSPKIHLYCWIQRQVPQSQPQGPQNAPQGVKPPPGIDVQSQILAIALRIVEAVEAIVYEKAGGRPTQQSGPNPDYVGDEPAPPDDDEEEYIPF